MNTRVRVHEIVTIAIVRIPYIGIAVSIRVRVVRPQVMELLGWHLIIDVKEQWVTDISPLERMSIQHTSCDAT